MKAQSVLGLGVAVFAIIVFWNADWYTLSFIFPLDPDIHMDPSVSSVTTRLKEAVNIDQPLALERVAVGYNTNLDLVCDGVKIMENLFDNQKSLKPFQSSTTIDTLEEFGSTFGFFFNQGSAAERLVSDPIVCFFVFFEILNFFFNDILFRFGKILFQNLKKMILKIVLFFLVEMQH